MVNEFTILLFQLLFLFVLESNHSVGKYISHIDSTYSSLFMDSVWKDVFEKPDSNAGSFKIEIINMSKFKPKTVEKNSWSLVRRLLTRASSS